MQSNVIQLADQLQDEASILLENSALWRSFADHGKIHVAGSTYLDLLIFPDLDVYFEVMDVVNILDVFSDAARELIGMDEVTSIEFEKDLHKRCPEQVPEGILVV